MNTPQTDPTKPHMTVLAKRPIKLLQRLESTHGLHVQCRLADGTDVHVPASELYRLFAEEMAKQAKMQCGGVIEHATIAIVGEQGMELERKE